MAEPQLPWLTLGHRRRLDALRDELDASTGWHGTLPVVLLERCWLRMRVVTVATLAEAVPPDRSAEAPELVRWRHLVASGSDPHSAQLQCCEEFGSRAFQQALRLHWLHRDERRWGWTFADYLELLRLYRQGLEGRAGRRLPLLVLRSADDEGRHALHWLSSRSRSMRHTCA